MGRHSPCKQEDLNLDLWNNVKPNSLMSICNPVLLQRHGGRDWRIPGSLWASHPSMSSSEQETASNRMGSKDQTPNVVL